MYTAHTLKSAVFLAPFRPLAPSSITRMAWTKLKRISTTCVHGDLRPLRQRQRRRRHSRLDVTSFSARMSQPTLATLVFFASTVFRIAEACSSRSTPKPRPPSQSTRPNITFPTFECPREYQNYYCLNGARCFTVKIENNILYNCECADGFTGPRCEFKDLDGSYLPNREKVMIETASIAGGVTIAVLLIVIFFIAVYVYVRRREKVTKSETTAVDCWRPFEKPSKSKTSKDCFEIKNVRNSRLPLQDPEAGDHHRPQGLHTTSPERTSSLSRNVTEL